MTASHPPQTKNPHKIIILYGFLLFRRIKEIKEKDYSISIETLKKICSAQGIKLSDFFKMIGE
jgi:uridine kinase